METWWIATDISDFALGGLKPVVFIMIGVWEAVIQLKLIRLEGCVGLRSVFRTSKKMRH